MKRMITILVAAALCMALFMGCDSNVAPQRPSGIETIENEEATTAPSASVTPSWDIEPSQAPTASASPQPEETSSLLEETTQGGSGVNTSTEVSGGIHSSASPSPSATPTATPSASPSATAVPSASPSVSPSPSASPSVSPTGQPSIPLSQKTIQLNVNGQSLDLALDKNNAVFDVSTLNTEYPAQFELITNDDTLSVMLDSKTAQVNQTTEITIDRIAYNEYIPVTVTDGQDIRTLFIRTLNSNIPKLSSAGESPNEGDYYLSFTTLPLILKLDTSGEIIYYNYVEKPLPETATETEEEEPDPYFGTGLWDFKKHTLEDGSIRYSYFEQDPEYNRLSLRGYAAGTRVVLDEKYEELDRIHMADEDGKDGPVDGHDFILIEDGHYIIANYELQLVDNIPADLDPNPQGSKVIAAHLQEVQDGEVLLDWYSTEHPELYALAEDGYDDFANSESQQPDYAHFNSMALDPGDDNLVCSFQNMSTILKIDRETGDIVWMLSGQGDEFGMTAAQKTSGQSDARFTEDGYLTVFDNGRSTEQSRILKLKLNEQDMAIEDFQEFAADRYTEFGGSAGNLGDDVFCIGWGMFEGEAAALTEIDFDSNQKLFELTLPEGVYTYRCAKFE